MLYTLNPALARTTPVNRTAVAPSKATLEPTTGTMPPKRKVRARSNTAQFNVADECNMSSASAKRRKTENFSNRTLDSRFLQLPRELRDQIYHHVWSTKLPFTITHQQSEFMVEYEILSAEEFRITLPGLEKRSKKSENPAPWFLVNKQILGEAIEQFQYRSRW
jgi:hypothetical protein